MGATALIAGAGMSTLGKIASGKAQKASLDFQAALDEQSATQAVASGIQGAIQERRKATYVASNAQAVAAASGGGASDPTVVNTIASIQGEGEYRALTSLYEGNDRSRELRARAAVSRSEGRAARTAGWMSGISTVLTAGGDLYDKGFFDKYGT